MRPLIINADIQARIDEAVALARANPTPWEVLQPFALDDAGPSLSLKDRKRGNEKLMKKLVNRSQFVEIPIGFLVAISFEYQPAGLCRHLSVSVSASHHGSLPHPDAVKMISSAFGFKSALGDRCWVEEFQPKEYAVNVVEIEAVGTA